MSKRRVDASWATGSDGRIEKPESDEEEGGSTFKMADPSVLAQRKIAIPASRQSKPVTSIANPFAALAAKHNATSTPLSATSAPSDSSTTTKMESTPAPSAAQSSSPSAPAAEIQSVTDVSSKEPSADADAAAASSTESSATKVADNSEKSSDSASSAPASAIASASVEPTPSSSSVVAASGSVPENSNAASDNSASTNSSSDSQTAKVAQTELAAQVATVAPKLTPFASALSSAAGLLNPPKFTPSFNFNFKLGTPLGTPASTLSTSAKTSSANGTSAPSSSGLSAFQNGLAGNLTAFKPGNFSFSSTAATGTASAATPFLFGSDMKNRISAPGLVTPPKSESASAKKDDKDDDASAENGESEPPQEEEKPAPVVFSGEEDETNVIQINVCKLHKYDKAGGNYVSAGSGILRVNKSAPVDGSSTSARIVMRACKIYNVLLNCPIYNGMSIEKPAANRVRITTIDPVEKKAQIYLFTCAVDDSSKLFNSLKAVCDNLPKPAAKSVPTESVKPSVPEDSDNVAKTEDLAKKE